MSTRTRIPSWRPASPQPWGSLVPMRARARDTGLRIVIRPLTGQEGSVEKAEHAIDHAIVIDPGPVAGGREDLEPGRREGAGVGLGKARRQIGVAVTPEDQGRTG